MSVEGARGGPYQGHAHVIFISSVPTTVTDATRPGFGIWTAQEIFTVTKRLGLIVSLFVLTSSLIWAHPISVTQTTLTLQIDGTFRVDMTCDLDALVLGMPQDSDDAELVAILQGLSPDEFTERTQSLRDLFVRRVRVRFDDEAAPFNVSFPDYGTPRTTDTGRPTVLGLTARLAGTVPPGATEVEFFASRSFPDIHLEIVDDTRGIGVRSILEPGARSDPFALMGPVDQISRGQIAWQYLQLGFVHIAPHGTDHILFVLGLFLLSPQTRPLLWQVTAFTVAHAVTLALGALGLITLSRDIVEPIIALSIAWVAIENILTTRLHPWRPAVVFLFGLLHGLGFAGVLADLGLPDDERLLSLLTFNVGIEIGQLSVIALALVTLGWFRHRPWYRRRLVLPLSGLIAVIGLLWTVERMLP